MVFVEGELPHPNQTSEETCFGRKVKPLLQTSGLIPIATDIGLYRIRIWRKSKRQPFGIQFSSSKGLIEIAEDLPHLDLRQFDAVVSVNDVTVTTVAECLDVLRDAKLLEIILERTELNLDWMLNQSAPARDLPLRTLLSCSQVQVLGNDRKDFEVVIERKSMKQRFGLNFSADKLAGGLTIRIAEDQPHLGLLAGDQLISVNGTIVPNIVECQGLLEGSMAVTLRLKRRRGVEASGNDEEEDDDDTIGGEGKAAGSPKQTRDHLPESPKTTPKAFKAGANTRPPPASAQQARKTTQSKVPRYPELKKHFATLGLEETDSQTAIRRHYHHLARVWHPDKNHDKLEEAKARFQAINHAYEAIRSRLHV